MDVRGSSRRHARCGLLNSAQTSRVLWLVSDFPLVSSHLIWSSQDSSPPGLAGPGQVQLFSPRGAALAARSLLARHVRHRMHVQRRPGSTLLLHSLPWCDRHRVPFLAAPPFNPSCSNPAHPLTVQDASLSDRLVHLCNHSVQKEQNQGTGRRHSPGERRTGAAAAAASAAAADGCNQGSGGGDGCDGGDGSGRALPSGSLGNMWTADQLRSHLRERFQVALMFAFFPGAVPRQQACFLQENSSCISSIRPSENSSFRRGLLLYPR